MSVSLFPQSPLSLHNELVKKVAMEVGMEIMHELSKTDICPTVLFWLQAVLSSQTANSKDQPSVPTMAHRVWASHLLAGWLCWMISIMEGAAFFLTRIDPYSGFRIAFSAQNTASKTTICGLKRMCVCAVIITRANWIWPAATLRGYCNEFMLVKGIGFYHVFHHLD